MTRAGAHADITPTPLRSAGVLPAQSLRQAIADGAITATQPIEEDQVQPASLDLRLGPVAWRVQTSFLPGRQSPVAAKLDRLRMYPVDLSDGGVLERGGVYIVPLQEGLALPRGLSALANPKSSTGRLDVFARIITDHGQEFDRIEAGYHGPLYAEISPRTFSIRVRAGTRLVQLRVRQGTGKFTEAQLKRLHQATRLVGDAETDADVIRGGIPFTVDVHGDGAGGIIGYKARRHAPLLDVERIGHYAAADFWEPITARGDRGIVLDPEDFYILASKETVRVPPDVAAEMLAYDTLFGEVRVHYAGFFDPGFGDPACGGAGSRAVLEVRSHEVPFLVEDGQVMGRLVYEPLLAVPDKLYGGGIGSTYQNQSLALSKQFKPPAA